MNTQNHNTTKISTDELQLGMYVVKLDRDWLDSPFLFQGFTVSSLTELETLQDICQHVWVTTETATTYKKPLFIPKAPEPKTMVEEYQQAHSNFTLARQTTDALLQSVGQGNSIDTKIARKSVESCVGSILRNPNAMMWMSKMRESDNYTSEHCLNVCILAIAFGRYLGKETRDLEQIGLCGLLHDVGKMRIPVEILNKPGKLSDDEWNLMKQHVNYGQSLLSESLGIDMDYIIEAAYSHHERVDGQGYPEGKKANELSEYTKIITLVDAYDAITAKRCYSDATTPSKAISIINREKGRCFDPHLASEFVKFIGLYPPGTIVELTNKHLGIIMERNIKHTHLPTMLLLQDDNTWLDKYKIIDLSDTLNGTLDSTWLIKKDRTDGYKDIFTKDFSDYILAIK